MKRYCFTLDLKDEVSLIEEYKDYHKAFWPEIRAGIKEVGILEMEIYLLGNRMFMVMETIDSFDIS